MMIRLFSTRHILADHCNKLPVNDLPGVIDDHQYSPSGMHAKAQGSALHGAMSLGRKIGRVDEFALVTA